MTPVSNGGLDGHAEDKSVAERLMRLMSAHARVMHFAEEWADVHEPCGTENCESPSCQLSYAVRDFRLAREVAA